MTHRQISLKLSATCVCCCVAARACAYLLLCLLLLPQLHVAAAPMPESSATSAATSFNHNAWPPMKHHDIWSAVNADVAENSALDADAYVDDVALSGRRGLIDYVGGFHTTLGEGADALEYISSSYGGDEDDDNSISNNNNTVSDDSNRLEGRKSRVIHLFPVPVDGECLSDDGRRTGTCFNAYECHLKGGFAKGECAMGFGVCCIFIASCNQTISNNITYMVSPNFPSFMPHNFSDCSLKVKMLNADISQLRIDFYHFSLGQPNRRTGVCDGDVFNVSGGAAGTLSLCGQNSGQHFYYDVGSRPSARQTFYGQLPPLTYAQLYPQRNATDNETLAQEIEIIMHFSERFLPIRLWEIRIAQIPFSQRAPVGCLQYHAGVEGVIQTFNFADNGRHLANQHYRICMRQETEMCSIMYQPCDEQSFRIGPSVPVRSGGGVDQDAAAAATGDTTTTSSITTIASSTAATDPPITTTISMTTTTAEPTTTTTTSTTTTTTTAETTIAADAVNATDDVATTVATSPLSDDVEGSGGDYDDLSVVPVSRRPRPASGGFDILGFLRNAFELRFRRRSAARNMQRRSRQFFTTCSDRITMPCIVEDFIGAGFGPLPGCEPVHCGEQFCASGITPCRIESTVTPFYIGVHFGDGAGKGSAEDNIGACLRYTQVQCM